jgi:O-acetylserine/cysteine efflux transporter
MHLLAAIAMVTIWGFNFVVIRWGLNGIPPLTLTMLRFALAAFPAILFVARPAVSWKLIAGYGIFAFAVQFGLLFSGMAVGMPAGLASLVIQVQAFFTLALVAVLLHERSRPIQLLGAVVAGAGLVVVAWHLPPSTFLGFVLVIGAALSWATANVLVKKIRSDRPLAVVAWGSVAAFAVLLPLALVVDGPAQVASTIANMSPAVWLGVAFQAWPTTLLAFGIWAWLLRSYPAALIAPFTLLVPVIGMSSAAWLLGEDIAWWTIAGGALVLAGLALNVLAARVSTQRPKART